MPSLYTVTGTSRKPGQRNVYKDVLYLNHAMRQKTFEILEIWVHGSRYYGVTSIQLKEYTGVNLIAGKLFKLVKGNLVIVSLTISITANH